MASKFSWVVIDCGDPERVASFWKAVLDAEVTRDGDDFFMEREGAPGLLFQKVPEPKSVKNRIHIDLNPVDRDQAAEVDRIIELGASRIDIGQGDVSWVVLADPEGNEFCVLRSRAE